MVPVVNKGYGMLVYLVVGQRVAPAMYKGRCRVDTRNVYSKDSKASGWGLLSKQGFGGEPVNEYGWDARGVSREAMSISPPAILFLLDNE